MKYRERSPTTFSLVKFEAEAFASGIIESLDDVEIAEEMGRKGHKWLVKNRSYETMAREVEGMYFEVLKGRSDEIQSKRH